jgi:outer membrane protein assembly factor BamB
MSPWVLLLIAIVVPPLGIVLLWTRTRAGFFRKLVGSLALVLLSLAHLHFFFGLRAELDGTGARPIFSFEAPESHYEELEQSRSEQKAVPPPPPSAVVETKPPEPVLPVEDVAPPSVSRDWVRFRGPGMDGRYEAAEISTEWPADGLPLLWKQPVGGGYASFVVASGRVFTIEQRRDQEVAAAYDLTTGQELWTHGWTAEFRETLGGDGPRATPTLDEDRVYALGASGDLKVLEAASGELHWERNILEDAGADNLQWGMSASPLIVDERVIMLPGGQNGGSVVAYDKRTGASLWKSLDDVQAYTSPMLVTLAGERQILVVGANRAMGLSVVDGSLLWDYPWVTNQGINVAQPLVLGETRVFLSAGYGHGAAVVEVTQDESGFSARPVWSNTRMKNKFASSVLHQGYIYGLDEAILACVDASTGELSWKGGRYGYGQLLLAAGHLIVLTERGELALVRATPEKHEELAMFPAIEGKTWNHPAIADGVLLVRNAHEMAAFRIAP